MVPVKIQGVVFDPVNRGFAVILYDDVNSKHLNIFVGPFEAQSIALELEKTHPPRPLTHDLLKNSINALSGRVIQVSIVSIRDNTYYATITLEQNSGKIEIDARPSDAIALALRSQSPILVNPDLLNEGNTDLSIEPAEQIKLNELKKKLEELIENENFEEAAKVRDEIRQISLSKKKSEEKNQ